MFLESFKITGLAVAQIFLLGATGYFLVKSSVLGEDCLDTLSRLAMEVTLPALIFCQLIKEFRFDIYPNWWIFPLLSVVITLAALAVGYLFTGFIKGAQHKVQFLSLVTFQNSGYLPLVLIAALLPQVKADTMFIYLFLFLIGFNLLVFPLGVYILSFHENKRFPLGALFSPPVIASILGLVVVFFGVNRFFPEVVMKPLRMIGDCTLPLAMFVVGGSLAVVRLKHIDLKTMSLVILVKLVILPLLGLALVAKLQLPELIGLLIILELAVPPATTLSIITRNYKKDDLLISQGIFFGHIVSLFTLPIFLSLYLMRFMIK
ncbi:MAG: AEC family transporter [Candidatus Omnitrophica bacterium]|nr:AEC family transporter [Candidatus Omnitrophota bacterium]